MVENRLCRDIHVDRGTGTLKIIYKKLIWELCAFKNDEVIIMVPHTQLVLLIFHLTTRNSRFA